MDGNKTLVLERKQKIDDLMKIKEVKMKDQTEFIRKANEILSKRGGLIDNSERMRRNLQGGVASSQRPGYFKYYSTPDDLKEIEKKNELKTLTNKIKSMQLEIDSIDKEIRNINQDFGNTILLQKPPKINSLRQWLDLYGEPQKHDNGLISTFNDSSHIYGKTRHHRAFRTVSKEMLKGRLIR